MKKKEPDFSSPDERRKYKRVNKHFILTYHEQSNPTVKYEITQLKNISIGGVCFVTSRKISNGTKLELELKTPYLAETTTLEGYVMGDTEKVKDMLYETRLQFGTLDKESEFILKKMIEFFINENEDTDE